MQLGAEIQLEGLAEMVPVLPLLRRTWDQMVPVLYLKTFQELKKEDMVPVDPELFLRVQELQEGSLRVLEGSVFLLQPLKSSQSPVEDMTTPALDLGERRGRRRDYLVLVLRTLQVLTLVPVQHLKRAGEMVPVLLLRWTWDLIVPVPLQTLTLVLVQ